MWKQHGQDLMVQLIQGLKYAHKGYKDTKGKQNWSNC